VNRLLEADGSTASVLDEPVFRHPLANSVDQLSTPRQLGPYKVLRSLGSGSVGDVYLAQRDRPDSKPVAIKVLRAGSFSESNFGAARFEVERHALSMLFHPHIARIHDAGCTDEGRAFIVMEYVNGKRIDEYCLLHGLSRRSRLTLFLQLCDAVQHAHQRGVIHRDLKPANVLVIDEPWPTVKVVDFGIAKIVGDPRKSSPTLTEPGQLLGTFEYMSPEQLDPSRGQVDARSDVYSLGVLLYQLMTNRTPFEDDDLVSRRAKAALGVHDVRPMTELPSAVRRDMEVIAGKALHPDPDKRYATPAHLAEDVRRFLNGSPVHARAPSTWYRLTKIAARHPMLFAGATVAAVASIILVLANMAWRVEIERERRVARDSIVQLLDNSLEQIRHLTGTHDTRRDIAMSLIGQTERLLQFRPNDVDLLDCRARLLDELGDIAYSEKSMGEVGRIRAEVLSIRRRLAETTPPTVERGRRLAEAIVKMGDYLQKVNGSPAGLALYEEAFAIHTSLRQTHPNNIGVLDDLCWSYERLSYVHEELGELEKAKEFRQSRLALARTLLNQSQDRALSQYNMAWAHARMVRPESDPDDALSATYLALGHAREAIQREPDRMAFRDALQYLLRMRAEAVIAYYGVEAGRPLLYEMLVETDNLASSNLNNPMLLERQVTNRLLAARLLLDHHAPADAARLASQTLGLANVHQRWSVEDNETEESVRCKAVMILEESARRLGRPLQPTVHSDETASSIVNMRHTPSSSSDLPPVDDVWADERR
jgi:serine/threonine protein kinase